MDIVVNDTNIFVDLISVDLLEASFSLPIRFHTVDHVIGEITNNEQKSKINALIRNGSLFVKGFDDVEFYEIVSMFDGRSNNVSVTDCAVWYYAKKNNYRILTGDGKLRRSATEDGVIVSGILFITDMLVECNIIDKTVMATKLKKLSILNKRLPKKLIEESINKYEQ